jgi:hypothetical protein
LLVVKFIAVAPLLQNENDVYSFYSFNIIRCKSTIPGSAHHLRLRCAAVRGWWCDAEIHGYQRCSFQIPASAGLSRASQFDKSCVRSRSNELCNKTWFLIKTKPFFLAYVFFNSILFNVKYVSLTDAIIEMSDTCIESLDPLSFERLGQVSSFFYIKVNIWNNFTRSCMFQGSWIHFVQKNPR